MNICHNRSQIGKNIFFTSIINKAQKTNMFLINLVTKLDENTAALNAVVPYVLSDSCKDYPTITELNRRLSELYGASCRGSVLKFGDNQVISLGGSCINDRYTFNGEKITDELAELMLNCLLSPCTENGGFVKEDFELKKKELLDDINAEINEKRALAFKKAGRIIYINEPCAVSAKGEAKKAEEIDAVSAYENYKRIIKTAAVEIIYVGSDSAESAENKFKSAFANIEREPEQTYKINFSPLKAKPEFVTDIHDVTQSKMVMAFKSNLKNEPAMRLMNYVFGGTPISKLFLNVREKMSLCYYCSSGYNDNKGVLYVDSGVEKENIKKAEDEIINQLNQVKNGNFTDKELNEARLAGINALKGIYDRPSSIAEWYFTRGFWNDIYSPDDEIERLNAVTRDDIIKAANSFTLDTVYVLTKKESAEN